MKKKTKEIKKTLTGIVLATSLLAGSVQGQTQGGIQSISSLDDGSTTVRPTMSYQLTDDISGFSFVDLQRDGYIGRTTLQKSLSRFDGLDLLLQPTYGSGLDTKIGAGFSFEKDIVGIKTKGHLIPFSIDKTGFLDQTIIGGSFSKELLDGLYISGFGEFVISGDKMSWGYGELCVQKEIGDKLVVGYIPALLSKGEGKLIPDYEHRIFVGVRF